MQWGAFRGRRLVLSDEMGEDEVFECASVINATKKRETTASVEVGLAREVTWELTPDHYMHFGKEHPCGVCFVFVSGPGQAQVDELTGMLSRYFEPREDEALLTGLDDADSIKSRRCQLVCLGIGAPRTADVRYLERIVAAMHDESSRIREGGLWAAMYALWPELLPEIDAMERVDSEPLLREQACALAGHMRKEGITP
ncbi:hypothetical protein [Streptomyces sp. NPDC047108]|uniref:hypothetical protein n=1 Tax=Streptomyces sp. NPDC047108 TaxID=3155025 RepID=UPI0033D2833E